MMIVVILENEEEEEIDTERERDHLPYIHDIEWGDFILSDKIQTKYREDFSSFNSIFSCLRHCSLIASRR